jgi:peptidoglycan/LPS O-acetylase OafA/YrhL
MSTEDVVAEFVALAGVLLTAGIILLISGIMLHKASERPFPASVVTALSVLGLVALLGYAVGGEERPELAAIAGTAVGALAGGATAILGRGHDSGDPPHDSNSED